MHRNEINELERGAEQMDAINVKSLSKSYDGQIFALKDINLSIPQGEIFGFLGPNGSGKTTTVRLLNGILTPTRGEAFVMGSRVYTDAVKIHSFCGVMTETAASYENLTGFENLQFFGKMYGLCGKELNERCTELLKDLDLYDARDKKVKNYSTGMKKKVSLARALIHRPKVLFLDEPTSGLDPEAAANVTNLISGLAKQEGVTVFLCTHQLKYAEDICTLYGFIHNGQLLGFGTFNELLEQKNSGIYLDIRGRDIPKLQAAEEFNSNSCKIAIKNDEDVSRIIREIVSKGGSIFEAKQTHWSLEDLYFSFEKGESK